MEKTLNVSFHKLLGKFLARVWASGKAIRIGVFDTAEEAGAARVRAEPMHGYHENHGKI